MCSRECVKQLLPCWTGGRRGTLLRRQGIGDLVTQPREHGREALARPAVAPNAQVASASRKRSLNNVPLAGCTRTAHLWESNSVFNQSMCLQNSAGPHTPCGHAGARLYTALQRRHSAENIFRRYLYIFYCLDNSVSLPNTNCKRLSRSLLLDVLRQAIEFWKMRCASDPARGQQNVVGSFRRSKDTASLR